MEHIKTVIFPKNKNIVIFKVPITIEEGKRISIKKCVEKSWRINEKRVLLSDILLAVDRDGIIQDIFTIIRIGKKDENNRKTVHVKQITDTKLRNHYIIKRIPVEYRTRVRYPILYNYS